MWLSKEKAAGGGPGGGQDGTRRLLSGQMPWALKRAEQGHLASLSFVPSPVLPWLVFRAPLCGSEKGPPEGPSSAGLSLQFYPPVTPPLGISVQGRNCTIAHGPPLSLHFQSLTTAVSPVGAGRFQES